VDCAHTVVAIANTKPASMPAFEVFNAVVMTSPRDLTLPYAILLPLTSLPVKQACGALAASLQSLDVSMCFWGSHRKRNSVSHRFRREFAPNDTRPDVHTRTFHPFPLEQAAD
jgi:hypothetical protein